MLSVIIFIMIFVGVTVALYQVYNVNYNINFGNEDKLSAADQQRLEELSAKAASVSSQSAAELGFDHAVKRIFGDQFARQMAKTAFSEEKASTYAIPLLRRRERLVYNGYINVRHLPFWKTRLPQWDVRGLMLTLVIVNCLIAQFLGAMSIYTILYEIATPALFWLNEPLILALLIYALIAITYVISILDMYMNDLYQIGKLARQTSATGHRLHSQNVRSV